MITFKRFGVNMGNLGNQILQYMTLIGFSKKYDCDFVLPPWKYSQYFKIPAPEGSVGTIDIDLQEPQFHYTPEWWEVHREDFKTKNVNITGWLQSEMYWEHCRGEVLKRFEFKDEFRESVINKMPSNTFSKSTIAISIRRGDYVGNSNYELLPIKFYLLALIEHFPDFRENYNIVIFTDDFAYAKIHFQCLPNVFYADMLNDIEQLCLGVNCDNFIIANSTFSWVMANLGEKPNSKVIRPNFLFAGQLKKENQEWSFYPERWTVLDHKIKYLDLRDVTFTIPVKFDSKDRMDNANLSIKLLRHDFDTNIIVGEQGHHRFEYLKDTCRYINFSHLKVFHRTKMLNDMAGDCRTPIVVNWDCDVAMSPLQLIEAAHAIRTKKAEMVYPYDGRFARVNRARWYRVIDAKNDVGMFQSTQFNGMGERDPKSVGGAIMYDCQAFIRGGMENENMISYGPEDAERYDRFSALGVRIHRVPGVLYHFDHILGVDSGVSHPYFNANKKELEKIRSLDYDQLRAYVDGWDWAKKYTPLYYESILEESVKSREVVFVELQGMGILKKGMSITDAGCALGAWGYGLSGDYDETYNYRGIDFGVPTDNLVIPNGRYIDFDLRTPLPKGIARTDLCLCLEVAEHLEPEYADQLIDNLCALSDIVLFSAAIPGQGGINHLNEKWQSFWGYKFAGRGYFPFHKDIRKYIFNNQKVGVWYRQNLVVYVKQCDEIGTYPLDFVHPEMYNNLMRHYQIIKE